jgi:hypothetical protein
VRRTDVCTYDRTISYTNSVTLLHEDAHEHFRKTTYVIVRSYASPLDRQIRETMPRQDAYDYVHLSRTQVGFRRPRSPSVTAPPSERKNVGATEAATRALRSSKPHLEQRCDNTRCAMIRDEGRDTPTGDDTTGRDTTGRLGANDHGATRHSDRNDTAVRCAP